MKRESGRSGGETSEKYAVDCKHVGVVSKSVSALICVLSHLPFKIDRLFKVSQVKKRLPHINASRFQIGLVHRMLALALLLADAVFCNRGATKRSHKKQSEISPS